MRLISSLTLCLLLCFNVSNAEGTRELAPNAGIVINGNETTDLAALHINNPAFNNFASYNNTDPHSRLYLHIKDPSRECVFMGFSFGHLNVTSPNPTRVNFEYRVKDPNGNVVFGPVTINSTSPNIQNWSQAFTGPQQLHGTGGYNAHQATSADLTSQGWSGPGDYYIEFLSAGDADLLIDFWDISVADCAEPSPVEKKGRLWSYNWSIFAVNDFGFPNRPFNGAFYVCAPDPEDTAKAFITKIDFNGSGFRPAAFNIAFNSFGSQNSGNIEEDRKSVQLINSTQSEYAIFLNDPIELCETAIVGEIDLIGISRCDADSYCIKFTTTKEGQVDLLLDFDGPDDIFTPGTQDVLITYIVTADQVGIPTCITWDGLDGFGNPIPEIAGTEIPITISYAQGIYHFPIYDAELMINGFQLQAVRPAASIPLLYYDDSNISVASGSGEPAIQLSGCNVPCHRWTQFIDNTIVGFGNLNTINSWWFSQRIVRQDVLVLPGYYTCEVEGPQRICSGSTAEVTLLPVIHPATVEGPDILSTTWTGPGIVGSNEGNVITVNAAGTYVVEMVWITGTDDTCSTSCEYQLALDPPTQQTIDTLLVSGEVIDINGELISEAGQYLQTLTNSLGCDSILTINVKVIQTVLYYDLNACNANMDYGTQMDYSEFTFIQPDPLSCADITATVVQREPPQMQKHSCTPGVNGSVAMCISAVDDCNYDAGNDATLAFEVTITPDPDTAIHLTGISFFEKAPAEYMWINGPTGPNNYPTLFGLRVLKNGTEIFRLEDIPTTIDWSEHVYDFLNDESFIIEDAATFRFELLPYCLIGNGAEVAAWDIDEIYVRASCAPFEGQMQIISGTIKTPSGQSMEGASILLREQSNLTVNKSVISDQDGYYHFDTVQEGSNCEVKAYYNRDFLNGVTTLDLILIQKHLLGKEIFQSPYTYIAADANKSNTVTAKDIIDLQRLILGHITELPRNTSWRFGNASQNNSQPWGFKETIDIESLENDYHDADFTAVKIGDINGNAKVNAQASLSERSTEKIDLTYRNTTSGKSTLIEILAGDDLQLSGLQMTIRCHSSSVSSVNGGIIPIAKENYYIENDALSISWGNALVTSVKKGDVLFFFEIGNGGKADIYISEDLSPEAYIGEDLQIRGIRIVGETELTSQPEYKLYQNEPNPFIEKTTMYFDASEDCSGVLTLTDLSGRIIHQEKKHFISGRNTISYSSSDIKINSGIVICRIVCNGYSETIKLIKL